MTAIRVFGNSILSLVLLSTMACDQKTPLRTGQHLDVVAAARLFQQRT